MRRISTIKCKPGMILAKSVYNEIGQTLISKGMVLTELIISRMKNRGIDSVFIEDSRTDDINVGDPISEKTREKALSTIKNTFEELYNEKLILKPVMRGNLAETFKSVLNMIIIDLKSNKDAMLMLSSIYAKDTYLYNHSLNVSLYSITIGIAKGLNQNQLVELGLGALLHDIGKTIIPIEVLGKPSELTEKEYELVRGHSEAGFEILRKEYGIPLSSAHCAFQHHERLNGSGYPRGLRNKEIHIYAKIVAIADVYDAVTSERVYKKPKLPHEALELLFTGVNEDFDIELVEIFKNTVAIYPIGTNVKLSSGESGIVVDINNQFPSRPVVRVLENEELGELKEFYEIDLTKVLSKVIVECANF
ncbi:MAG: HD-GYP domain-containing protein [Vulcanibacillus sp.]